MALDIRVYCDGAGKEKDHPVITVGGFLADETICESIERDWEIATGGRVFHLADFGTRTANLGSGNWPEKQRVDFLKRLAAIINREGVQILSASLEVQPYNEMLAESPHAHVNGPAFSGCGQATIANADALSQSATMHAIKERGKLRSSWGGSDYCAEFVHGIHSPPAPQ
jgi:hypothetical protein